MALQQQTFTGSALNDIFEISNDDGFTRIDAHGQPPAFLEDVQLIEFKPLRGEDLINIQDLTGTDVLEVTVNLENTAGGGVSDSQADAVVVSGTIGNEFISISGSNGSVTGLGLPADLRIKNAGANDGLQIRGGFGNDTIDATGLNAGVMRLGLSGGFGDDLLKGGFGNDSIDGEDGADSMSGGKGNDVYFLDNDGDSVIENQGEGKDTVKTTLQVHILDDNVENAVFVGDDNINLFDNDLNNRLTGSQGDNHLTARVGNDTVSGLSGDDDLNGGEGNDRLIGGEGQDVLAGNDGSDVMIGGSGNDTYFLDAGDLVVEAAGEGADIVFATVQKLDMTTQGLNNVETAAPVSSSQAITIVGNGIDNALLGGNLKDTLAGSGGADRLVGFDGSDALNGGTGTDTLLGGLGRDIMTGGANADTFEFREITESVLSNQRDVITDFSAVDFIDLSRIDADDALGGEQAFTFIGAGNFTGVAGELHAREAAGDFLFVEGDVNGDGAADFQIAVLGVNAMNAGDFIL